MELPDVGKHCLHPSCNKLDFLPIRCDVCKEIFCGEHYSYASHDCRNAYRKDNQVPVCPLCNRPVPVGPGRSPDLVVGAHIDSDCQSDPAVSKRKVFANKCSLKGCKKKEVIPLVCDECTLNYCLKHRHPHDHRCGGKQAAARQRVLNAALARQTKSTNSQARNGPDSTSEDEALARALALSMQEGPPAKTLTQEELDLALARQLQATEYQTAQAASNNPTNRGSRCTVT